LERSNELIAGKRRVFETYRGALADLPLAMNPEPSGTTNGYWMPTIVVNEGVPFDRQALLATFKADHIDGRVFFWPLSSLPVFPSAPTNKVAQFVSQRAINLPSYHDLCDAEILRIVTSVSGHIGKGHV
jgi:perosamine synthetase